MADANKCGFKNWITCAEDCKYFSTCTRNPHRKDKKDGQKNGRCKVDKDHNRHV